MVLLGVKFTQKKCIVNFGLNVSGTGVRIRVPWTAVLRPPWGVPKPFRGSQYSVPMIILVHPTDFLVFPKKNCCYKNKPDRQKKNL